MIYKSAAMCQESTMEYLAVKLDLKRASPESGEVEGYAALFGVEDEGGDTIEAGAFSPIKRSVKMLFQHESFSLPVGVWDEVREDTKGLLVKRRISGEIEQGRELKAMIEMGAIDSLSIGYRTLDSEADGDGRLLKKIDLFEVSFVTFPMQPGARLDLNSLSTVRDLEMALRDAGFSRKVATGVAAHGFKGLSGQREAGRDEPEAKEIATVLEKIAQLREAME